MGRSGQASFLTPDQQARVMAVGHTSRRHTAVEIRDWIETEWRGRYRGHSLHTLLHHLGMRLKVPRLRAKTALQVRAAWNKGGGKKRATVPDRAGTTASSGPARCAWGRAQMRRMWVARGTHVVQTVTIDWSYRWPTVTLNLGPDTWSPGIPP